MDKFWYNHAIEYYAELKKKWSLKLQKDVEEFILLSERSQSEGIHLIWFQLFTFSEKQNYGDEF